MYLSISGLSGFSKFSLYNQHNLFQFNILKNCSTAIKLSNKAFHYFKKILQFFIFNSDEIQKSVFIFHLLLNS